MVSRLLAHRLHSRARLIVINTRAYQPARDARSKPNKASGAQASHRIDSSAQRVEFLDRRRLGSRY